MSRSCVAWSDDFNVLDNAIYKSPVARSLVTVHPSQHTRLPTLPSSLPSYSYSTMPNTKPPKQQRPPRPRGHAQSSQPIPAKASPPSLLPSLRPTSNQRHSPSLTSLPNTHSTYNRQQILRPPPRIRNLAQQRGPNRHHPRPHSPALPP